jgi:8-oxo-dGTP diphosphatase
MRERPSAAATEAATRRASFSVDLVLITPRGRQLVVLLERVQVADAREKWSVPFAVPGEHERLEAVARRLCRGLADVEPAWLLQVGAFDDEHRHPSDAELSVGYVGVIAQGALTPVGGDVAWFAVTELPTLAPRQRALLDAALEAVRSGIDQSPIAFRLLPATFTLTELQQTYELLLGRRLHKASFRRALQAAWLVEPTDEWRSEGRGRPAQLFRYAPRKRRAQRRGVRFDLLGA